MRTQKDWLAIFAYNIRRLEKLKELTAEEIAKSTGIHPATISQLKNNPGMNPTLATISGLAGAFNVPVAELFREPDPNKVEYTSHAKAQYLTFSQWFWEAFTQNVPLTADGTEKELRRRFDAFLSAVVPSTDFSDDDREAIWRDRNIYLKKHGKHLP